MENTQLGEGITRPAQVPDKKAMHLSDGPLITTTPSDNQCIHEWIFVDTTSKAKGVQLAKGYHYCAIEMESLGGREREMAMY